MRVVLCHTDEHADVFLKEGERLSSELPIRVHNVVVTAFREAVCVRVEAEDIDFLLDENGFNGNFTSQSCLPLRKRA